MEYLSQEALIRQMGFAVSYSSGVWTISGHGVTLRAVIDPSHMYYSVIVTQIDRNVSRIMHISQEQRFSIPTHQLWSILHDFTQQRAGARPSEPPPHERPESEEMRASRRQRREEPSPYIPTSSSAWTRKRDDDNMDDYNRPRQRIQTRFSPNLTPWHALHSLCDVLHQHLTSNPKFRSTYM